MKNNVLFNSSTFLPRARYLCLFILAFVLGISQMWGAADYDSSDWDSEAVSSVLGTHGSITISGSLGSAGNVSGHYYLPISTNLKNSDDPWNGYLGIASTNQIDSVEILYCPNGKNQTSIAWAAWGEDVTPNQYTLGHGVTSGTTSSKAWDNRVWEKINLSAISAYTVYFSRSIREFREIGGASNISNFGAGQTINVLGIRVWLHPSTPATTYTVTYKANGSGESDEVDDEATEIADNMFTYSGKAFTGWNTEDDGTGDPYEPGDEVEEDLTLYAQWSDIYTVTYDKNGGTGSMDATENEIVACTFTAPSGKGFKEWNTAANGKGTTYAVGATVTADLALYAIWQNVPTTVFDWTAANSSDIGSDNTDLSNATYGTLTTGTSVAGRMFSTNTIAKNASGYKLGNNDVCIEIQGTSDFVEGDTVIIVGKNGGSGDRCFAVAPSTTTNAVADTVLTSTISSQTDNSIYKVVITSTLEGAKLRVFRKAGSTMYCKSIKVRRPAAKDIVSTVNTLTGVKLNGTDISSSDLSTLTSTHSVALADALAEAPTITFNKHTVITYDDASTKVTDTPIAVEASVVGGNWSASTTIDAVTYTVTAVKLVARTVTYKDGTTTIGTEIVADGTKATASEISTAKELYTFDGWYNDAELTSAFDLASTNITADKTLYGKWSKAYAQNVDIEDYAMNTSTDLATFKAWFTGKGYAYANLNGMDNTTTNNGAYAGVKTKSADAWFKFNVPANKRVTVKLGYMAAAAEMYINGTKNETQTLTGGSTSDGNDNYVDYSYDITVESQFQLKMTTGSTCVLKAVTIGDIPAVSDDATLSDLKVGGTTITGFSPSVTSYYVEMPYGTAKADLPLVTVTTNDAGAEAVIQDAKYRDDMRATIHVTAADGETDKFYYVYFSVASRYGVEIIKATHTGKTTATVTGYIGGSVDKSTQDDGKLGSNGHYFGIKLAEGNFKAGDKVKVVASVLNGGNTATMFTDKGTTALTSGTFDTGSKTFEFTLSAETEWVYIYRASSACNPNIDYIAVYREMDPVITSFEIDGIDAFVIDQTAKTISATVAAEFDVTALTPTITAWANGGATLDKTGAQDFSSAVTYTVTSLYDESVTYTVNIFRPARTIDPAKVGSFGTFCPDKAVVAFRGVTFYELAGGLGETGHPTMLIFNEVEHLIAGMPYLFVSESTSLDVVYEGDAVATAGNYNGFYGTLEPIVAAPVNDLTNNFMMVGGVVKKCGANCSLAAGRGYFKMEEVTCRATKEECYELPGASGTPNSAPNRRHVALNNASANQATGLEYLTEDGVTGKAVEGCFDVLGRKVAEPQQNGVYILNGKKVVIVK